MIGTFEFVSEVLTLYESTNLQLEQFSEVVMGNH